MSLLPRFLSAFKWEKKKWIVMYVWTRPNFEADSPKLVFDLKGTTHRGRIGDKAIRYVTQPLNAAPQELKTGMDLNAVEHQLYLAPHVKEKMLEVIKADTEF